MNSKLSIFAVLLFIMTGCGPLTVNLNDTVTLSEGKTYISVKRITSWEESNIRCNSVGGNLVIVKKPQDIEFLLTISNGPIWLGLSDKEKEGAYKWVNGDALEYANWDGGEPNNQGNEDYVQMFGNGKWNDLPNNGCGGIEYRPRFICEFDSYLDKNKLFSFYLPRLYGVDTSKLKYSDLNSFSIRYSTIKKTDSIKDNTPLKSFTQKSEVFKSISSLSDINFGKYNAIVIGNNNYQYLPGLKTAIHDAKTVSRILERNYNFSVNLLINATRADILRALNKARRTLTAKDNLLIYYAGHGWLDKEADQGYWIPVDAEKDSNINWIANATITGTLRAMSVKHVMLVADSCYSGKLTRGLKLSIRNTDYLSRLSQKKARTVLTSGGLEPVMDSGGGNHSVFAKAFINALSENQNVLDGHKLLSIIRRPVMLESDQTPEYSDIRKAGHDGGDFLFVRKK